MSAEEHIHYAPESPAVDNRAVLLCALGALILLAGAIVGSTKFTGAACRSKMCRPRRPFRSRASSPAKPKPTERRRLAAAQQDSLETWRWANDQHTLVQIPIERAMQLLVQKGAAAYDPLLPPPPPPEKQP